MSDSRLTRRVQVFIGREASDALDALVERTGKNQTALIEWLLLNMMTSSRARGGQVLLDEPVPVGYAGGSGLEKQDRIISDAMSREPEPGSYADQKAKRDEKKQERRERKAKLQESVSEKIMATGENGAPSPVEVSALRYHPRVSAAPLAVAPTFCPFHRPKWCEPSCKHRVSA